MATTRPHAGNGHLMNNFTAAGSFLCAKVDPVDDDVIKGHALIASGGLSSLKNIAAEDIRHSVWWVVEGSDVGRPERPAAGAATRHSHGACTRLSGRARYALVLFGTAHSSRQKSQTTRRNGRHL